MGKPLKWTTEQKLPLATGSLAANERRGFNGCHIH